MFIAIEGGDGSGKTTQVKLLTEFLQAEGKNVHRQKFPQYGQDSAYYVEQYLNGAYGQTDDVPADLGVLPYAIDRHAASASMREILARDDAIIICDRYMGSNLAHQGAKIGDTEARKAFYERTKTTEYSVLGIPKADLNIVLVVPAEVAQRNASQRDKRQYTELTLDIHEADATHLEKAKRNYEELCELYPDEFIPIVCTDANGQMRPIDEIQAEIRQLIDA